MSHYLMADSSPTLVGFADRKFGAPVFDITLSDAAAALLVTGSLGSHLESLHPLLGSLAENIDPVRLRPYVLTTKGADELDEAGVDRVISALMGPVTWMRDHTAERLPVVVRRDSNLCFELALPEAYWLGATVEAMTVLFMSGAQRTFLMDLGQNLADLFTSAELMMGWRIEQNNGGNGVLH